MGRILRTLQASRTRLISSSGTDAHAHFTSRETATKATNAPSTMTLKGKFANISRKGTVGKESVAHSHTNAQPQMVQNSESRREWGRSEEHTSELQYIK